MYAYSCEEGYLLFLQQSMAKHHPSPPPPPSTGTLAHTLPTSPPSASQLSLQLKQDLAKLAHNDPDTRRSSLEALKGFIEGELDARSMPGFLEQVSGETGKSSGSYAISLFAEVARVHKQDTVPFIPRIMTAVLRTLASSSGGAGHGNNLHQACAKVMSAVARYAIEPTSSATRSSLSTDVLDSLCQPLLGLLSSNVEPVAVGSATCLQAVVEAENWKLAAPELVHDVCCRSSISLIEKGKHSVAHLHLMRSLAKFNAGALHDYDGSLLKVGVHVLCAMGGNAGACGSWQQRVAAAQLLGTLLGGLDQRALPSELIPTIKALECCRLDKVAKVRQAVGEALSIAKNLASQIDPLLLHEGGSEVSTTVLPPIHGRPPESRKRAARKKNLWKTEESCGSTLAADDIVVGSQESQLASYASSPSSSITSLSTPSLGSPSPPSAENSAAKIGRSPLYPAKQSPVFPPSPLDRYMAESDLPYILAHRKSSDFKENTPLVAKGRNKATKQVEDGDDGTSPMNGNAGESLLSSKSDDILYNSKNKVTKEVEGVDARSPVDDNACTIDGEYLLAEECTEMDSPEADSSSERDVSTDDRGRDFANFSKDGVCKQNGCRRNECMHGFEGKLFNAEPDTNAGKHAHTVVGSRRNSFNGSANRLEAPRSQVTKKSMSAEDFLIFSTPRKLVRSLQSVSSSPDSKCSPERDQGLDFDCETLSESGWSVRDNPMADENEDDLPRSVGKGMLTKSIDGPLFMHSCREESSATQIDDEKRATRFGSADGINSALDTSMSRHSHDSRGYVSNWDDELSNHDGSGKSIHDNSPKDDKTVSLLKLRRSKKWASCARVLRKMQFYAETFLFGALLMVLAFTTIIAVLRIKGQQDLHMLVPT